MEVKKKLKFSLKNYGIALNMVLFFMLALGLQMICCSTCYASTPTPINQMTPQIARNIFKHFYDNSGFDHVSYNYNSTKYNSFYNSLNDDKLQSFCTQWNTSNVSNYAQYLENCFFILNVTNNNGFIFVYFLNNELGNLGKFMGFNSNDQYYYCNNNGAYTDYTCLRLQFDTSGNMVFLFTINSYLYIPKYNTTLNISNNPNLISCVTFANYSVPADIYKGGSWYYTDTSSTIEGIPEPTPVPTIAPTPTVIPNGTITNNSGETTGNINLNGIEQGITGIQNQISGESQRIIDNQIQNTQTIVNTISGETQKITNTLTQSADETIDNTVITSGDIASTVDFSPINDSQEYTAITNFWYELLNSFSNALTNVNRSINIEFRGQTYTINLDDFTLNIPTPLKVFLSSFTTALVVIYISKNIKHIIEDIQTASIDNVANKLTDDFETNLF